MSFPSDLVAAATARRDAQGLPPTITDAATLDRVAELVRTSEAKSHRKTNRRGSTSAAAHVLEAGNAARPTG